jgi:hypothetical protein
MRSFGASTYLLSDARVEVRLVYSAFLALSLIGLLTMAAFQVKHIGVAPERIATYYRGGTRDMVMTFPKTFRELVELTHVHSFVMGIVYLVLAHLFLATTAPTVVKRAGIVLAFVGLAGDLLGTWLIVYVSSVFAYTQLMSWGCQWIGFGAFYFYSVRELWFSHGREALPPE